MYIYREIRRRHECGYKLFNIFASELWAEEMNIGVGIEKRGKERETEEVIAMAVCEEEGEVALRAGAAHQCFAQANDAAARIEYEGMWASLYFDAGGIATVPECMSSGCGITAAHAPEAYEKTWLIDHETDSYGNQNRKDSRTHYNARCQRGSMGIC